MKKIVSIAAAAAFAVSTLGLASAASAATCIDKGGRGTGSTVPDAKFQAWEAVLQATDWGMWGAWITSSAKVGKAAAGYKVSHYREKCHSGGALGKECIIRAKLCK
ncbi:MAG: hypothetical protein AB7L90_12885 [Hyphomicrobiaceae bacterium]